MTELEQLKNEYKNIPVPSDGPERMLTAMADARRRRNRWKRFTQYGAIAAAALLAIVLLPRMLLFSGGFGQSKESASMSADCMVENTGSNSWFSKGSADEMDMEPAAGNLAPEAFYGSVTSAGGSSIITEAPEYSCDTDTAATEESVLREENFTAEAVWKEETLKAISEEILRQMEERMTEYGDTYYTKSENYPQGFEKIIKEQKFYVNSDGLLVVVFEAGTVAPEEQGSIEFVIPAEIALP